MASKFFTWTKGDRRAAAETYRTGGLFPIVTDFSDPRNSPFAPAQNAPRPAEARPPQSLSAIAHHETHGACLAPASALHNAALSSVSSASNLLAVVNEMLRSPALVGSACPRSPLHKPLPGRPRSISLPPTPDIAELPGSLLLENQGFPPASPVAASAVSQTMRSVRSGNLLSPTLAEHRAPAATRDPRAGIPHHKKSSSEARVQRRSKSRPSLIPSPSSTTESKLTACSASTTGGQTSSNDSARARAGSDSSRSLQPSPMIVERKNWKKMSNQGPSRHGEMATHFSSTSNQVEELKSTITAQDQTISTLSAQFASLQTSHEAHIASLTEAHAKEISSLKTYNRVLEEQSQQKTLHHASSNHLLMLLDTAEPQSPTSEWPPQSQTVPSAASVRSFQTALEEQSGSTSRTLEHSAEMSKLLRSISIARRPNPQVDAATYDELIKQNKELSVQNRLYKQNHEAFQKQIGSLMDKLREANADKKDLQKNLDSMTGHCNAQKELIDSLKANARTSEQNQTPSLEAALENVTKLRNSNDYLELRLQLANIARVDALEQIYNLKHERNPFTRPQPSEKQLTIDLEEARMEIAFLNLELKQARLEYEDEPQTPKAGSGATKIPLKSATDGQKGKESANASLKETSEDEDQNHAMVISAFVSKIERLNDQIKEITKNRDQDFEMINQAAEQRCDAAKQRSKAWQEECNHLEQKYNRSKTEKRELKLKLDDAETQVLRLRREMEYFKKVLESEVRKHGSFKIWSEMDDNEPLPKNATREDIDRMIALLQKRLKAHLAVKSSHADKPRTEAELRIEQLSKEVEFYVREIIYYKLDIKGYKKDIKKLSSALNLPSEASSPNAASVRDRDTPIKARFAIASPSLGISATPSPTSIPMSASSSLQPATPATSAAHSSPQASPSYTTNVPASLNKNLPPSPSENKPPQTPERRSRRPSQTSPRPSPLSAIRTSHSLEPVAGKTVPTATLLSSNPTTIQRVDSQRSASDSIITMYTSARTPDWSPPKTTPERPTRPRHNLMEFVPKTNVLAAAEAEKQKEMEMVTVPGKAPMRGQGRSISHTTAPMSPTQQRKRSGSGSGSVGTNEGSSIPYVIGTGGPHNPAPMPPQQRKRSGSGSGSVGTNEGSSIPFVIGMGSPHNPTPIPPQQRKRSGSGSGSVGTNEGSTIPFVIGMGSPHNPALYAGTGAALGEGEPF